jgi:hypothetical protein
VELSARNLIGVSIRKFVGKMSKSKRKWIRLKKGRIIRRMLRLINKNRMG